MFKHKGTAALAGGVVAACLLFSSCSFSSSAVLTTLTTIVDASAAVVGVLSALSPPGSSADAILQYAEAASTAASESIAEWQSKDSTAEKLTIIAGDFAAVLTPQLGPTVSPEVQAIITTLSNAIQAVLNQVRTGALAAHTSTLQHQSLSLSIVGHYKLHSLKAKADNTVVRAEQMRAQLRGAK
jgi:hypothetical protein